MEGDPLFTKATVVQYILHRPMQHRVRLLQKQELVMECQSSALWVQKAERCSVPPFLSLPFLVDNTLLGYMTAEISFLGKLYLWPFDEDLGSWKPVQHRKREKQLPERQQTSEIREAEEV